jgi:DNA-binding response OmpR family regulator
MKNSQKRNTILIVDDDPDVRRFASRLLELEGYQVMQAATEKETFQLLRDNDISLVLLDIKLAENNGWMILKKIKEDKKTASIPVMAFTASFGEQQRHRAIAMGAADYLVKPLSARVLKEAVGRVPLLPR